jgi:hypothetical protein
MSPQLQKLVATAWQHWIDEITIYLEKPAEYPVAPHYDDLVLAAAGLMPSRVMRFRPSEMTPPDWSELALEGAMATFEPERAPVWALVAGLRAQRFGRELIQAALERHPQQEADRFVQRLLANAPSAPQGVLVITASPEPLEYSVTGPYLIIDQSQLDPYQPALDWLTGVGAFRSVIDER